MIDGYYKHGDYTEEFANWYNEWYDDLKQENIPTWYTELEVTTIRMYLSTETTSCTTKKSKPNKKQTKQKQYNNHTNHHHKKCQNTALHIHLTAIKPQKELNIKFCTANKMCSFLGKCSISSIVEGNEIETGQN
eukprot:3363649-Amphidinium_carterae.2